MAKKMYSIKLLTVVLFSASCMNIVGEQVDAKPIIPAYSPSKAEAAAKSVSSTTKDAGSSQSKNVVVEQPSPAPAASAQAQVSYGERIKAALGGAKDAVKTTVKNVLSSTKDAFVFPFAKTKDFVASLRVDRTGKIAALILIASATYAALSLTSVNKKARKYIKNFEKTYLAGKDVAGYVATVAAIIAAGVFVKHTTRATAAAAA